ncbi:hypothetical protein POCGH01_00018000 [Plasmodium ovale]|uniref:Uncharacterized protein n=1 Tax=Plasmodium ovale TaxID=36330 RepID=A0A1D3JGH2_PLAOA|nr:hypothetical protein POCGH01_00018000 [Plasmodium ovale]
MQILNTTNMYKINNIFCTMKTNSRDNFVNLVYRTFSMNYDLIPFQNITIIDEQQIILDNIFTFILIKNVMDGHFKIVNSLLLYMSITTINFIYSNESKFFYEN